MAEKGQGDHYYNTDYKFSPRVRELLAKKLENVDMSYMRVENIVTSVMRAEYTKTLTTFTEKDKEKLMNMFINMFTTNLPKKNVDVVISFLKENWNDDEIKVYVDHALNKYKPGVIYQGIRISNHTIINFLEGLNTYPLMKGIIINKKYINDLVPFFDRDAEDFEFDPDTLLVEKDYTNEMLEVFNGLVEGTDIRFHNDDDIFVLATFDDEVAKQMTESFKDLEVQSIPVHKFEWSKSIGVVLPEVKDETELEELIPTPDVETETVLIPPTTDIPKYTLFESTKPTDILINGYGYGKADITFLDDFFSVGITKDGKRIQKHFETDGAVFIHDFKDTKRHIKGDDVNALENGSVEFLILRNFVGKINLNVTVNGYDDNDKKHTFQVKPGDYSNDDIYYELTEKYEKLYGDADMDISLDIDGTFDKSEDLTMDIYNSL